MCQRYPNAEKKPKHHYVLHAAGQLYKHGITIDAFVGERKHNMMKGIANAIKNTAAFEKTLLTRAVCMHIDHLSDPMCFSDRLINPVADTGLAHLVGTTDAWVANSAVMQGVRVASRDLVRVGATFYEIAACAAHSGKFHLLARVLERVDRPSLITSTWTRSGDMLLVTVDGEPLRLVDAWTVGANGITIADLSLTQ